MSKTAAASSSATTGANGMNEGVQRGKTGAGNQPGRIKLCGPVRAPKRAGVFRQGCELEIRTTRSRLGNLKKIGAWLGGLLIFLLIASAALSITVMGRYQLAVTGELPIHTRHSSGTTVEPFEFRFFVGAAFYALVFVIGVVAVIALIDKYLGIPIVEKYPPRRRRRVFALLAAISFVLPIVISVTRGSTAN